MLVANCVYKYLSDVLLTKTEDTYNYYKYHCVSIFTYFFGCDIEYITYDDIYNILFKVR